MRGLLLSAIGASVLLASMSAAAEGEKGEAKSDEKKDGEVEGRLPLSYTERPLTLPRLILNPIAEFAVARNGLVTFVDLAISVAFGITDDLEIEQIVAPLQLSPRVTFGQDDQAGPSLGATYRFLKGSFELGAHFDAVLITYAEDAGNSNSGVILRPGIPARLHLGKSIRIDAAAYVPIVIEKSTIAGVPYGSRTITRLQVPLAVAFDLIEPLHVGVSTGVSIEDLGDTANTFAIPLGAFAGYAIGGKDGPILDIDPFFRWPTFATPGVDAPGNKINADKFQVGLELGGFLYL